MTKIMSTHGTLSKVISHRTREVVNGEIKNLNDFETLSRHNVAKHFNDDVNNRQHDPIGLYIGWATDRWDHQQLDFFVGGGGECS